MNLNADFSVPALVRYREAEWRPSPMAGVDRLMLDRGFRTDIQGVSMHRPNEAGLDRGDVFAMNDWR